MKSMIRVCGTLLVALSLSRSALADRVAMIDGDEERYPTIQAAIDAAPAGATILIGCGDTLEGSVYAESLHITRSLDLRAFGGVDANGQELYPTIQGPNGPAVITATNQGVGDPVRVGLFGLKVDATRTQCAVFAEACELTVDACELAGAAAVRGGTVGIGMYSPRKLLLTHSVVSDFAVGVNVPFEAGQGLPGALLVEEDEFDGVTTALQSEHADTPRIVNLDINNIPILDSVADADSATKISVLRRFHGGYGVYLSRAHGGLIARVRVGGVHIGFGIYGSRDLVVRNTSFVDDLDRLQWFSREEWLEDDAREQRPLNELAHGNGGGIVVSGCVEVQVLENSHCFGGYGAEDDGSERTLYRRNIFKFHEQNVTRQPNGRYPGTETDFSENYFGDEGVVSSGPTDVTWRASYEARHPGAHGCMSDHEGMATMRSWLEERPLQPDTPPMFTPGIGTSR